MSQTASKHALVISVNAHVFAAHFVLRGLSPDLSGRSRGKETLLNL